MTARAGAAAARCPGYRDPIRPGEFHWPCRPRHGRLTSLPEPDHPAPHRAGSHLPRPPSAVSLQPVRPHRATVRSPRLWKVDDCLPPAGHLLAAQGCPRPYGPVDDVDFGGVDGRLDDQAPPGMVLA